MFIFVLNSSSLLGSLSYSKFLQGSFFYLKPKKHILSVLPVGLCLCVNRLFPRFISCFLLGISLIALAAVVSGLWLRCFSPFSLSVPRSLLYVPALLFACLSVSLCLFLSLSCFLSPFCTLCIVRKCLRISPPFNPSGPNVCSNSTSGTKCLCKYRSWI